MQVLKDNKNIILLIIFFFFLTSYQIKKINIFTFFKVNEVEFIGTKNFEENLKDDLINSLNNKTQKFLCDDSLSPYGVQKLTMLC